MRRTIRTTLAAAGCARGLLAEATATAAAGSRWLRGFGPEHVSVPSTEALRATVLPDTPVMLIHGLGANKSYFVALEDELTRAGYTVYCVNYGWVNASVAACGTDVAASASRFLAETGAERIHVVAHSLGGVVLRWALTHTDLGARVGVAVTLGSPHRGTPLARLAPRQLPVMGTLLAQLRTESVDLAHLADPADLPHVTMVAIGGGLDWVVPPSWAMLPAGPTVENVVVADTGHIAMATHPTVIRKILTTLHAAEAGRNAAAA